MSSETTSNAAPNPLYRVASGGLTLTGKGGRERDLPTGATIRHTELLRYVREQYIRTLVRVGDLEVVDDA